MKPDPEAEHVLIANAFIDLAALVLIGTYLGLAAAVIAFLLRFVVNVLPRMF